MATVLAPSEVPAGTARPVSCRRWAGWLFLGLLLYQAFHQLEHAIETVQLEILHHAHAHTLLAGLDFEWVHFGANVFLEWGLLGVFVGVGPAARRTWRARGGPGWWALVTAVVVQGYHVIEHVVRIIQYLANGGETPEGTVTQVVNPVWYHFGLNLTVLLAMAVAFFGLGFHRRLVPARAPGPAS